MNLSGSHILVLGLGESGLAMARWCDRRGAHVRIADTRTTPPFLSALKKLVPAAEFIAGDFRQELLAGIDLLALSPGLPGDLPIVSKARLQGMTVTGEIELFARGLQHLGLRDRSQVVAITGTNGKTTTTALTGHLCRSAGKVTAVAGNISPAALDALMTCEDAGRYPDVWVLELSSYQLETLETLAADAATVLNISEDHLDRYAGLDDYAAAKARIFKGCKLGVFNRNDARVVRMAVPGLPCKAFGLDEPSTAADFGLRTADGETWLVRGTSRLMPLRDLPLAGLHNAANTLAAIALCEAIGIAVPDMLAGVRSFSGLPHRVERVADIGGITWYDDSKGTNVGATVAALEGLQRKVVLILGGEGKQQDFSPLHPVVEKHARAVVLIGRDARIIRRALMDSAVPLLDASSLEEAVALSAQCAQKGDAVLLSPACASFDMFRNYEHRAQVFVDAVHRLERTSESRMRTLQ